LRSTTRHADFWCEEDDAAHSERLRAHTDPDHVRDLALRAIETAQAAGATYADARLTRTVEETFLGPGLFEDGESLGIGVRALVNGAWGFAASPYWELDEAEQLAKAAVEQATINARISPLQVDLGQYPVASGAWRMPIRIDPFAISLEEKIDFVRSFDGYFQRKIRGYSWGCRLSTMRFKRQERAVATTDGAYFTQTVYQAGGNWRVSVSDTKLGSPGFNKAGAEVDGKGIELSGAGWELLLDAKLRDQIPHLVADAEELLVQPTKPVDVGRYDVVCDAHTMASLVDGTLGQATELDRSLGYEANAGGTSYLGPDPSTRLGTSLGVPLLNVHGDRSMPKGLATVKWDDEGVAPEDFPIIEHGVVVDYQTTREQAVWLRDWYTQRHQAVRSHGCAGASSALRITQESAPNLTLGPGSHDIGFDELVAGTKRGLAFIRGNVNMDFQSRSGLGTGMFREIRNGKLGAIITGAGGLFDSTELWKNLTALGGNSHRTASPFSEQKGEPTQTTWHSVSAVPGSFKSMAIIDTRRQA
jgi:TldD protein